MGKRKKKDTGQARKIGLERVKGATGNSVVKIASRK